jgi:hypothetical protein
MFFMFRQKSPSGLPRVISAYAGSAPFVLNGPGSPAYLADHPVEALALKALFPASPAVAVGPKAAFESVAPFLKGQGAVVAERPLSLGRRLATLLRPLKPRVLKVPAGESWLELWRSSQEPFDGLGGDNWRLSRRGRQGPRSAGQN